MQGRQGWSVKGVQPATPGTSHSAESARANWVGDAAPGAEVVVGIAGDGAFQGRQAGHCSAGSKAAINALRQAPTVEKEHLGGCNAHDCCARIALSCQSWILRVAGIIERSQASKSAMVRCQMPSRPTISVSSRDRSGGDCEPAAPHHHGLLPYCLLHGGNTTHD